MTTQQDRQHDHQHDHRRERNARVIAWIGLLVAGVVCAAASLVVDTGILWQHSTGCDPGPADPAEVSAGRWSMAGVLVVLVGLWLVLWTALARYRTAVVVAGLVGLAPAALYLAYALNPDAWVGGFCIPF